MDVADIDVRAAFVTPNFLNRLRRRIFNGLGWGLMALAFLSLAAAMISIFVLVFVRGAHVLSFRILAQTTQGMTGGLLNAIEGTAVISFGGILLAMPPGIAAGIYLSEFPRGYLAPVLRFMSDVLVGVPSIVVGYFAYILMVVGMG